MLPRGTIILYDNNSIDAIFIRVGSGEGWTHSAVALGDGTAIQCEFGHGVCILNEGQAMKTETIAYPGDVEKLIANLEACKGDHYDIIGLAANFLWNVFKIDMGLHPHAWVCSTFMAAAMLDDPAVKPHALPKPIAAYIPQDFQVMFG